MARLASLLGAWGRVALFASCAAAARAEEITFAFAGTRISQYPEQRVGVVGSFTFETTTPASDSPLCDPNWTPACYAGAVVGFVLEIPATGFRVEERDLPKESSAIGVRNYEGNVSCDGAYGTEPDRVFVRVDTPSATLHLDLNWRCDAYGSDALPISPSYLMDSNHPSTLQFQLKDAGLGILAGTRVATLGETALCLVDLDADRSSLQGSKSQAAYLRSVIASRESLLAACRSRPDFLDSDGDGEGDATDACPATALGASTDSAGCSREQFCSPIAVATKSGRRACASADFGNDEPGDESPLDCQVLERPRRCVSVP
jgi:hypothetical protein